MRLTDFIYELPDERIARYPLDDRDASKLLFYNKGAIEHRGFRNLPELLPAGSLLVFNNSRVIPARLIFTKDTGAHIEVFITEPYQPALVPLAMEARGACSWHCMVGNKKRWKAGSLNMQLPNGTLLKADWVDRENDIVALSWDSKHSFAEIIEEAGKLPIPPYLNRDAEESDYYQYQTIYSKYKGAVAAPTAGLHFTEQVLADLEAQGIATEFLTLHVSAGTFKPVTDDDVMQHDMHAEQIVITTAQLDRLLHYLGHIIAVGTTSMRILESLYWMGVQALAGEFDPTVPLPQQYAIERRGTKLPAAAVALQALKKYMTDRKTDMLITATQIYITPGYRFKLCKGLITNYHQPGSTLIILVAAFIGDDWKKVYREALDNGYRFLSYGDSSLLLPG